MEKDTKILEDEEFCHYSGLPSVKYYETKQVMQEKESKTNWHFYISIVKSVIRIGAGGFLISGNLIVGGALLITAEVLGIVEEL